MPAVELTRLQTQIRLAAREYSSAEQFVKQLSTVYEFYSDRTFNPLASGKRPLSADAYNVTPLINRQFELEFGKLCQDNPLSSLDVIDRLWEETKLEPRQLAAALLGKIPLEYSAEVIDRLQDWSLPTEDRDLIAFLHNRGSARLRREDIDQWLAVIQGWLESKDSYDQVFGLQSLLPMIKDSDFHNLPRIFEMLSLVISFPLTRILTTLQKVIEALAARSPVETVFYLKSVIAKPHSAELPRLFRRLLPVFPAEQAASLRLVLREKPLEAE
jgi:hypothetical protein